jgi:hypothetical protein
MRGQAGAPRRRPFFHGGYESTRDLVRRGRLNGDIEPPPKRGKFSLHIEPA